MMRFSVRKGQLELRSCNERLGSDGEHNAVEIVAWSKDDKPHCWTLVYYKKGDDGGWDIFFLDRALDQGIEVWDMMKLARCLLREIYV